MDLNPVIRKNKFKNKENELSFSPEVSQKSFHSVPWAGEWPEWAGGYPNGEETDLTPPLTM